MKQSRGFTLVELLVALFILALMAILSWRGLDGMARAQEHTQARADEVLALQAGLSQWQTDLDAIVQLSTFTPLDWNGRVLRMTRRSSAAVTDGIRVVAWTRREGQWLRWQSPPLTRRGDLEAAWARADQWSQNPGTEERRGEVAIAPLEEWQLFYYRSDAWTNPLSSDAATAPATPGALVPPGAPGTRSQAVPDGVRLVLVLPPGRAITGRLTRDWINPVVGGNKS